MEASTACVVSVSYTSQYTDGRYCFVSCDVCCERVAHLTAHITSRFLYSGLVMCGFAARRRGAPGVSVGCGSCCAVATPSRSSAAALTVNTRGLADSFNVFIVSATTPLGPCGGPTVTFRLPARRVATWCSAGLVLGTPP